MVKKLLTLDVMDFSMRITMLLRQHKAALTYLKKGGAVIGLILALTTLVSACAPAKGPVQPLTIKQQRQLAYGLLAKQGVLTIHRGNQVDILIPTDLLFNMYSTNLTPTANQILDPLYHALTTYDIQTVRIQGLMLPGPSADEKLLNRARAGQVGQSLWWHGLGQKVPLVYGGLRGQHIPTSDLTKNFHAPVIWVHWRYYTTPRMYD